MDADKLKEARVKIGKATAGHIEAIRQFCAENQLPITDAESILTELAELAITARTQLQNHGYADSATEVQNAGTSS